VFRASVPVPGDKSLSHRALILAAMAPGVSEVTGAGPGRDVESTRRVLGGVGIEFVGSRIQSPGIGDWQTPDGVLDCGNSGTTLRLMAGALAGRPGPATLTGDASLRRRPMERLVAPLAALGASITTTEGTPPVTVAAPEGLRGADVSIPIASAQVRSAVALAALQAVGSTIIDSPAGFRDHTERWLDALGRGRRLTPTRFEVIPGPVPAGRYAVPGDPSSAAYLWAAAALVRGAAITTPGVSLNPGRIGFLQVLDAMGAQVEAEVTDEVGGDPVGTVTVRGKGLFSTDVAGELAVATLDELPLVAVVAAFAEGISVVKDAAELRAKESDRIASTVQMIRSLGGGAEATDDGFAIIGTGFLEGGRVDSHGDHRIAMAAAVAAARTDHGVEIVEASAADVSWPGFYDVLEAAWSSP
jgi:3-phosphoshikimate 1-carboxyvinyltransferase